MGARWLLLLIPVVATISVLFVSSWVCDDRLDTEHDVTGGSASSHKEVARSTPVSSEESENFPPAQPAPLDEETSARPDEDAAPTSSLVPDITEDDQKAIQEYQNMIPYPFAAPYVHLYSDNVQGAHSVGQQAQYVQLCKDDALEQYMATSKQDPYFIPSKAA
jgi:hypothetical protein